MQHNIVLQAEQEEGNRLVTYYSIDMMEVLLRNRIPLYMDVVESKYKEAVCSFSFLFVNEIQTKDTY